ncbi:multi-sensor domain-containing two-component system histidine kinase [Malaciobacter marinus]|uniref:histidine kinase n=1 Tax=Malaciobacter marinus TaxID=505249 RepID=A0A347TN45_9BACT|nr:ATP-binding protein [Malaciobacter marinus]AXX88023.1 multi-sensor domain-containing two-component system histidine kinase [Malaciobacter marinus]PHO16072.1 histidine kinase [Malaciobacter marinus]
MKHNRVYILISIVFFLLYIFIIFATYNTNKTYLLNNTINTQLKLVHSYKEKFDEKLSALKRIVETMGKKLIKKDRFKDFNSIKEMLTTAMISGDGFKSVYISYPDNFTISGRTDWYYTDDYIAVTRPWYVQAVNKGKTTISKPYVGSAGFEDKLYISIASPIYDKNKNLLAVMSSDLELKSVQKEISKFFPFKKGFAFLMTNDSQVIVQSNKLGIDFEDKKLLKFLETFQNNKKGDKTFKIDNQEYIFTFERLKNSDWLFVSVLQKDEIFKTLNQQLFMNLISSLILFLLGLGTIIFISITQKKLYEKHLLLGHFAKSPTWGILLTDKNGNILFINKVFEKIFNIKSKSLYEKPLSTIKELIKNEKIDKNDCFDDIKKNLFSVKSYNLKRNNKTYRVQMTPLLNNFHKELEGTIITVNDISHEKYLEKKESEHEQILIQNSKMAALGEMVSAISHQWRQPLSTLLMLISNAEEIVEKNSLTKAHNYLLRSRDTIELMNETVNAFRNFYKEEYGKKEFNLIKIIKEVILISFPQMQMNGIELEFDYDKDKDYECTNYPSYIKQVLINLFGNAKDELSFILRQKPLYEAKIKINLYRKKEHFYISVEDNGRGILKENKDKIFKPFFTTKNQGTGTGLYLCDLLVKNRMNGNLYLNSLQNPTKFIIKIGVKDV